jgi:Neuraminidase (sialidase)
MPQMTRRRLLQSSGALAVTALVGASRRATAAPVAKVESATVISKQPQLYHGWPTLTRRRNGDLLLVCSGGREAHVCPFGRVEIMRSYDNGHTWKWPQVLLDGPIDDRDSGVLETPRGSILVTTFTSLAFEPILEQAEARKPDDSQAWPQEKLDRWRAARDRIDAKQREKEVGVWMIRSPDGGVTWSVRYDSRVNSPHGPIALSGNRLLYAGKVLWTPSQRIGVCESTDDGQRPGDDPKQYHELHAVEAADARIVVHIRNHNNANKGETLQSESTDGGKTWSEPRSIGVWGYPSHLLRLKDGRLLMSYGHRRKPVGNQARVSEDHGKTWSEPLILSDDAVSTDLGYPSTVELNGGTLLSVWYEVMRDSKLAVLRQAKWRIET